MKERQNPVLLIKAPQPLPSAYPLLFLPKYRRKENEVSFFGSLSSNDSLDVSDDG